MELNIEAVRRVFEDLLDGRISREEADKWARFVVQEEESGRTIYVPAQEKARIWRAVMYLNGVDLKNFLQGEILTEVGTYLHSDEDIRETMQKLFDGES
ncbi:hypothetical protein [Hyphomicrobium sp.]|uniref:hypothetical protein n=1 Tax=Hyphomicrobium sp. TaxID=82 RepID=UPI003F702F38